MTPDALDIAVEDPAIVSRGLTRADLVDIADAFQRAQTVDLSIDGIIRWVAAQTGVHRRDILGPYRDAGIFRARALATWGARHALTRSMPQIGRAMHRDHSSILHAVRRAEDFRQSDQGFRALSLKLLAAFDQEMSS